MGPLGQGPDQNRGPTRLISRFARPVTKQHQVIARDIVLGDFRRPSRERRRASTSRTRLRNCFETSGARTRRYPCSPVSRWAAHTKTHRGKHRRWALEGRVFCSAGARPLPAMRSRSWSESRIPTAPRIVHPRWRVSRRRSFNRDTLRVGDAHLLAIPAVHPLQPAHIGAPSLQSKSSSSGNRRWCR